MGPFGVGLVRTTISTSPWKREAVSAQFACFRYFSFYDSFHTDHLEVILCYEAHICTTQFFARIRLQLPFAMIWEKNPWCLMASSNYNSGKSRLLSESKFQLSKTDFAKTSHNTWKFWLFLQWLSENKAQSSKQKNLQKHFCFSLERKILGKAAAQNA